MRWTAEDLPDLTGSTALVTGANNGLGLFTALELARHGAEVILAGRNLDRGTAALARIRSEVPAANLHWQPLDLAELASVRAAADAVTARAGGLDLLVNNAGVMMLPRQVTVDGFESQFAINYLGHFALTGLLLPALLSRPAPRVVSVASNVHRQGRLNFDDLHGERRYSRSAAYSQSKLANLVFALELARQAAGTSLVSVAAHPGFAATGLGTTWGSGNAFNTLFLKVGMRLGQPAAIGALATLRAATEPDLVGGEYFGPAGMGGMRGHPVRVRAAGHAYDEETGRRLWAASEQLTGVTYEF